MTVEGLYFSLKISLLAGVISLDNSALMQVMISQPLIACSIIGTAAGQPLSGVVMGVAFQLLFAVDLPVGSHLPKDSSLMSMSALCAVLILRKDAPARADFAPAISALLAVSAAPVFSFTGRMVRRLNNLVVQAVRDRLTKQNYTSALVIAQLGLLFFFMRGFLVTLTFSLAGSWIILALLTYLPNELLEAANWSFIFFPLIGAAHIISRLRLEFLRKGAPVILMLIILNLSRGIT